MYLGADRQCCVDCLLFIVYSVYCWQSVFMGKVCISAQTDSVVGSEAMHGCALWKMGDCRKAQRKDGWLSELQMGGERNKDKPG